MDAAGPPAHIRGMGIKSTITRLPLAGRRRAEPETAAAEPDPAVPDPAVPDPAARPDVSRAADDAGATPDRSERPARPADQPPGEIGGPRGPEPTRYGDWEVGGRCTDF